MSDVCRSAAFTLRPSTKGAAFGTAADGCCAKVTVIGSYLFDATNGWDGAPAAGDELVVVTRRPSRETRLAVHRDASCHTAGSVEAGIALAKELAGESLVRVTAGDLGGAGVLRERTSARSMPRFPGGTHRPMHRARA